jgi:hypothetical protein
MYFCRTEQLSNILDNNLRKKIETSKKKHEFTAPVILFSIFLGRYVLLSYPTSFPMTQPTRAGPLGFFFRLQTCQPGDPSMLDLHHTASIELLTG